MFSRIGKETIIKDLTFVGQPAGGKGAESTFEQQRKREALGKKRAALKDGGEGEDDEDFQGFDLDDFYNNTAAQPGKEAAKGPKPAKPAPADKKDAKGEKGAARDEKDAKQKKKDQKNKSQDMANALMMGQQKQSLHTIFENIHAELEHKEKLGKRKRIIGEVDTAREAELFRNMNATYKSGVKRFENQCYKINCRPVSLNEGNYRVNYEPVDPKV